MTNESNGIILKKSSKFTTSTLPRPRPELHEALKARQNSEMPTCRHPSLCSVPPDRAGAAVGPARAPVSYPWRSSLLWPRCWAVLSSAHQRERRSGTPKWGTCLEGSSPMNSSVGSCGFATKTLRKTHALRICEASDLHSSRNCLNRAKSLLDAVSGKECCFHCSRIM